MATSTTGLAHGPVVWRAACRHLGKAHEIRGGTSCSLPLRRSVPEAQAVLGQERGMPICDCA
eukprot:9491663-Pyramimonas_sp.AAC.2